MSDDGVICLGLRTRHFLETENMPMATRNDLSSNALVARELQELKTRMADLDAADAKRADDAQRAAILATRGDIGDAQRAVLAYVPLAELRRHLASLPRLRSTGRSPDRAGAVNPTLGRLTADERHMLASVHTMGAPTGDIVRATKRGSVLEMPMHIPTPTQAANRIKELEAELEAHRAEYGR